MPKRTKKSVRKFCLNCENEIKRKKPSLVKKLKFCCPECFTEYRNKNNISTNPRKGKYIKCKICGKEVYAKPSEIGKKKTCSYKCAGKLFSKRFSGKNSPQWKQKKVECDYCGKKFYKYPNQIERSKRDFCSKECNWKWQSENRRGEKCYQWKGGTDNYDSQHRQWRKKIYERDNYTCQICGKKGSEIHAHHIKPWVEYPDLRYNMDNGKTLCKKCHMELHGYKLEKIKDNKENSNG